MSAGDASDGKETRLIDGPCRRFDKGVVQPKRLGFNKIDPVFDLVGQTLSLIEFKLHPTINSIENIPFQPYRRRL